MNMIIGFAFLAASVAGFVIALRCELKRTERERPSCIGASSGEKTLRGEGKL